MAYTHISPLPPLLRHCSIKYRYCIASNRRAAPPLLRALKSPTKFPPARLNLPRRAPTSCGYLPPVLFLNPGFRWHSSPLISSTGGFKLVQISAIFPNGNSNRTFFIYLSIYLSIYI